MLPVAPEIYMESGHQACIIELRPSPLPLIHTRELIAGRRRTLEHLIADLHLRLLQVRNGPLEDHQVGHTAELGGGGCAYLRRAEQLNTIGLAQYYLGVR